MQWNKKNYHLKRNPASHHLSLSLHFIWLKTPPSSLLLSIFSFQSLNTKTKGFCMLDLWEAKAIIFQSHSFKIPLIPSHVQLLSWVSYISLHLHLVLICDLKIAFKHACE